MVDIILINILFVYVPFFGMFLSGIAHFYWHIEETWRCQFGFKRWQQYYPCSTIQSSHFHKSLMCHPIFFFFFCMHSFFTIKEDIGNKYQAHILFLFHKNSHSRISGGLFYPIMGLFPFICWKKKLYISSPLH